MYVEREQMHGLIRFAEAGVDVTLAAYRSTILTNSTLGRDDTRTEAHYTSLVSGPACLLAHVPHSRFAYFISLVVEV
jgi:hypothetical protein